MLNWHKLDYGIEHFEKSISINKRTTFDSNQFNHITID